jgi:hypothetical protein
MALEFLQPITSIAESASTLSSFAGKLAAVIPKKKKKTLPGIGNGVKAGFVFVIVEDDNVEFSSDVTDHYIENNTAMQDHIALKPVVVRVRGLVAEIDNKPPGGVFGTLSAVTSSLGVVSAFVPNLAAGAQRLYNQAEQIANTVNKVVDKVNDIKSIFTGKENDDIQTKAYKFFRELLAKRTLCTVETPWELFKNMAIMSISATQGGDTRHVTSFEMTFKQIQMAGTLSTEDGVLDGRAAAMAAKTVDAGLANGTPVDNKTAGLKLLQELGYFK